jgi:hypothetical protein
MMNDCGKAAILHLVVFVGELLTYQFFSLNQGVGGVMNGSVKCVFVRINIED